MIYLSRKDVKKISLPGYKFRLNTKERFENYALTLLRYNKDLALARRDLYNNFGNTYWFYVQYISPFTHKKELKFKPLK